MTIEERAELAVETFAAGKGNCTQSVLCAWEDKIPVDHDTLMKLGAGYGAGMGCMQATCGALIGAVMAAGSVTRSAFATPSSPLERCWGSKGRKAQFAESAE